MVSVLRKTFLLVIPEEQHASTFTIVKYDERTAKLTQVLCLSLIQADPMLVNEVQVVA